MIEVSNLRKKYGEIEALKGVSFRVRAGEIYGLLGPNGAGKSTAIGILCGLVTPDAGQATLNGPEIARSMLEMTTLIGNGLYANAVEPISRIRAIVDAGREPTSDEVAVIARGFFESGRRLASLQGLSGPTVGVQRPGESAVKTGFGNDPGRFFAYVFPGLVVFGLLFIAQALAMRLMRDRLRGLQRASSSRPSGRAPSSSSASSGPITRGCSSRS